MQKTKQQTEKRNQQTKLNGKQKCYNPMRAFEVGT